MTVRACAYGCDHQRLAADDQHPARLGAVACMKAIASGGKTDTRYELRPQEYPDRPVPDRCWLFVPENVTQKWIAAGLRPA